MPVASGGFELRAGASVNVSVPDGWIGSWTPRTGCAFDAEGLGSCEVGDCGGVLACDLDAGLMPQNVTTVSKAATVHVLPKRGGRPALHAARAGRVQPQFLGRPRLLRPSAHLLHRTYAAAAVGSQLRSGRLPKRPQPAL